MDISEGDSLFLIDRDVVDDHFEIFVRINVFCIFIVVGDFLLRFELGELIKFFGSNTGLIFVKFKIFNLFDSIDNLLTSGDSHFFNFVTLEEQIDVDKVLGVGCDFLIEELIILEVIFAKVVFNLSY